MSKNKYTILANLFCIIIIVIAISITNFVGGSLSKRIFVSYNALSYLKNADILDSFATRNDLQISYNFRDNCYYVHIKEKSQYCADKYLKYTFSSNGIYDVKLQ